MGNEEQEIIVNVNVTELNEIVTEIKDAVDGIEVTYSEQIIPSLQQTIDTLTAINTCCVTISTVMIGVFVYDYCKRIFKKKSVK